MHPTTRQSPAATRTRGARTASPSSRRLRAGLMALATAALALGGCDPGIGPSAVASVHIQPAASLEAQAGTTLQLAAEARAADGRLLPARPVSWSSSDGEVASVGSDGLLRALRYGSATISATVEGVTGRATLTVPSLVARIELSHAAVSLDMGEILQVIAVARGHDGVALNPRFSWTSSDTAVARVAGGRITGVGTGTATVTVTSEGRSASVAATVAPWTRQRLLSAVGAPLPAAIPIGHGTAEGGVRLETFVIEEGMLRQGAGRYQLVLRGRVDGAPVVVESMGVVMDDVFDHASVFFVDGADARSDPPRFRGEAFPAHGSFRLEGAPTGIGPAVALTFEGR